MDLGGAYYYLLLLKLSCGNGTYFICHHIQSLIDVCTLYKTLVSSIIILGL